MKPRTSMGPPGIPTPRRRSLAPSSSSQPARPPSALDDSAEAIAQLQAAMSKHNPAAFASPEYRPPPGRRVPSTASSMASSSRSVTPASPTRPRPKTPSFSSSGTGATPAARRAPPLPSSSTSSVASEPQLGDTVKALGFEGVLRFLGSVSFKDGEFAGIELMGASRGKGKNDGTVQGERYFACDPLCGLFVPASKVELVFQRPFTPALSATITSLPRPPSTTPRPIARAKSSAEAARAAEAKITQGSRASKYLTMTAAQLATRQAALGVSTPTRRAASPDKPTTPFTASTTASATPRTRGRPSMGLPTPSRSSFGGRKSVGGAAAPTTPTPRTTYKRPPSALGIVPSSGSKSDTPDVPPLPPSFLTSGRMTPSRRASETSTASGSGPFDAPPSSAGGRPETPARSFSRQSNASVASVDRLGFGRPSSRLSRSGASMIDSEAMVALESQHRDAIEAVHAEKATAVKRAEEARVAQGEAERAAKTAQTRFEELRLRLESSEARTATLEAAAAASGGEADRLQGEAKHRLRELEEKLVETERAKRELAEAVETSRAKEDEAGGQLRRQLDEAKRAATNERAELTAQLDQLREAGQALCGVYEERLDAAEAARQQVEETLRSTEDQLEAARRARAEVVASVVPQSPRNEMPSPSALAIDNESLRAEVEHLRGRLGTVEENLEEARANLEAEVEAGKQKRQESGDAATTYKNEVKALKERLDSASRKETLAATRMAELEHALRENRSTLERERAELEGLRAEATSTANAEALQRQLDAMRADRDKARQDAADATARAADAEEELRLTEELHRAEKTTPHRVLDLEDGGDPETPTRSLTQSTAPGDDVTLLKAAHERELHARDTEIRSLRLKLSTSDGSPMPLRVKRGSEAPSTLMSSRRSGGSPLRGDDDEASIMTEQLAGLKAIISQLTEENRETVEANKRLQRDLEATRTGNGSLSVNGSSDAMSTSAESHATAAELAEVQRKLEELERRSSREVKSLNQEVADLESLVEAKIFKEDELSDELDRYRRLLAKAKEQGFVANGHTSSSSTAQASARSSTATVADEPLSDACELCGQVGHEIEACPIFGDDAGNPAGPANGQEWCEDCETSGHTAENCPVALETF